MRVLTAIILCTVAVSSTACGDAKRAASPTSPPPTTTSTQPVAANRDQGPPTVTIPPVPQHAPDSDRDADDQRGNAVDRANDQLTRAAHAKDRRAVARAQRKLDELARTDTTTGSPAALSVYQQALGAFKFKQAPLYAQQLLSSDVNDDHRAYAGVMEDLFCLSSTKTREGAATAVYAPLEQRMRKAGITDFALIIVAVAQRANPQESQALAIGRHGQLRLTKRGQTC